MTTVTSVHGPRIVHYVEFYGRPDGDSVGDPVPIIQREVRLVEMPSGANCFRFFSRVEHSVRVEGGPCAATVVLHGPRQDVAPFHFINARIVSLAHIERIRALIAKDPGAYDHGLPHPGQLERTDRCVLVGPECAFVFDPEYIILDDAGKRVTEIEDPELENGTLTVVAPRINDVVEDNRIKGIRGQSYLLTVVDNQPAIHVDETGGQRPNGSGARIALDPSVFTVQQPLRLAHSRACDQHPVQGFSSVLREGLCLHCHHPGSDLSPRVFFWLKYDRWSTLEHTLFHADIRREYCTADGEWVEQPEEGGSTWYSFWNERISDKNDPTAELLWNDPDGDHPIACDHPFHVQQKRITFEVRWTSPDGHAHRWEMWWTGTALCLRPIPQAS
ncbi:hypothetical protein HY632_01420 [Candidatus Uhrbacteria bacterium]|nr:hypothetical protein [Candidatus Uhrbacteria bacterium]